MSTIAEAMDTATAELRLARVALEGVTNSVSAQLAAKTNAAQTVINNFLGRPPVVSIFVDPVAGNDTADGGSPSSAKKDLDAILDNIGLTATAIFLLNDVTIRRRRNINASIGFTGCRANAINGIGYEAAVRTITFLAEADNSPNPALGRFASGFFLTSGNFSSSNINWSLPDRTVGSGYAAHIFSSVGVNVYVTSGTLLVQSANAGALIYNSGNTMNVYSTLTLGTNAAGHLFLDVAAGANPNALFSYKSNVTSA